ncbi:hypothetical protein BH24DEI2_BH24DEI2_23430 [soil metagenome]
MPRFSLIIPTYNRAALLKRTLHSVFAQTFQDFETLVVDDGSADETVSLLESYADRVTALRQANRGPGSARNLGVEHAQGEYVVFLDSDDLLLPWSLAVYDEVARAYGSAIILSKPDKFSDEAAFLATQREPLTVDTWPDYLAAARARYPITVAAAVRTDVLRASGGFLEENISSEDHDLFLRLGTAPGFAFVTSPVIYGYRQHEQTKTNEFTSLLQGVDFVLNRDRRGEYAGGAARRRERDVVLARMFRYGIKRCFETGYRAEGYQLFLKSAAYYPRAGFWRDLYRLPLAGFTRKS